MSRRAATATQIKRTLKAFRDAGETVSEAFLQTDGSVRLVLTKGGGVVLPSDDQAEAAWDKALGLQ